MKSLGLIQDATCHVRKTFPYKTLKKPSNLYNIDFLMAPQKIIVGYTDVGFKRY